MGCTCSRTAISSRRRRASQARSFETLEARLALSGDVTPVLAVTSVSAANARAVTVVYDVADAASTGPIELLIARSSSPQYNASTASTVAEVTLSVGDLTLGTHTTTVQVGDGMRIEPSQPYMLAMVDPSNTLGASDTSQETGSFQILVVGAVADGYQPTGRNAGWVTRLADELKQVGYDTAIAFNWAAYSDQYKPGEAVTAGERLADFIESYTYYYTKGTNDVVDLHLIGFDRGAVVMSQALEALQQAGLPSIEDGWTKLTLLDPISDHPGAPSRPSGPLGPLGPLGRLAERGSSWFKGKVDDPAIVIPGSVDQSEIFYQRNTAARSTGFLDRVDNPVSDLGQIVVQGSPPTYYDVTRLARGHRSLPDLYLDRVAPQLGLGKLRVPLGRPSTRPPLSPSHPSSSTKAWAGAIQDWRTLRDAIPDRNLALTIDHGITSIDRSVQAAAAHPAKGSDLAVAQIDALMSLIESSSQQIPQDVGIDLLTILGQDRASLTGTDPPPVPGVPKPHGMGLVLAGQKQDGGMDTDLPTITGAAFPAGLPSSVDLESDFPQVYDQGDLGNCVDNGVAGAVAYLIDTSTNPAVQALEAQGFSPSRLFLYYNARFIYAATNAIPFKPSDLNGNDSGSFVLNGLEAAETVGMAAEGAPPLDDSPLTSQGELDESALEEEATVNPGTASAEGAINVRITGFTSVLPQLPSGASSSQVADATVVNIKQALAAGNPVVFGIPVYEGIYDAGPDNPYITPEGDYVGGHCMVAVGYDDNYTVPGYSQGAFIIRNSWGTDFGQNGYAYMPYAYLAQATEAYTVNGLTVSKGPSPSLGSLGAVGANALVDPGAGQVVIDTQQPAADGIAATFEFTAGAGSSGTNYVTPLILTYTPSTGSYAITGIGQSTPVTPGTDQEYPFVPIAGSAAVQAQQRDGSYSVFGYYNGLLTTTVNTANLSSLTPGVFITGARPSTGSIAIVASAADTPSWMITTTDVGAIAIGETFATDPSAAQFVTLANAGHGYSTALLLDA